MIKLPFDSGTISRAKQFANDLGKLKNSITGGAGNKAGYLGEIALADYLKADLVSNDSYSFDIVYNGQSMEVKTKRRTIDPKKHFEVSVAETSRHQKPDLYAFISITFKTVLDFRGQKRYKNPVSIWLCGTYDAERYFENAKFVKVNEVDSSNGFKCLTNMYNLPISELWIEKN